MGVGFGYWYGYPYYGYPYYGYPYGYGYGYGPRYGYGYGYGPGYGYGYAPSSDWAVVDTDVSPESARVYIDGQLIGTADDFDGFPDYLYLRQGRYKIEFRLPGFETRAIDVDAHPGTQIDVGDSLAKIPGAAQYGSYDEPIPSGAVRRFYGKRGNVTGPITDDGESYGAGPGNYRVPPGDRNDPRYNEDRGDNPDYDVDVQSDRPAPREQWRERGNSPIPSSGDTWIRLRVEPSDAAIYMDDRFIGTVSQLENGIAVLPGSHTFVVSRPGYRDKRFPVNVSKGETQRLDVRLEK